jgi:hypothetical protein
MTEPSDVTQFDGGGDAEQSVTIVDALVTAEHLLGAKSSIIDGRSQQHRGELRTIEVRQPRRYRMENQIIDETSGDRRIAITTPPLEAFTSTNESNL